MSLRSALLLALAACSATPAGPDAASQFDASTPDAGIEDAGERRDAGRPVFLSCDGVQIEIPARESQCGCAPREECFAGSCTYECAPCSSLSPCPAGWECTQIDIPFCEGMCRRRLDDCALHISAMRVVLEAEACTPSGRRCDFIHSVGEGVVDCSVNVAGDDAGTQLLAQFSIDVGSLRSLSSITCYRDSDFSILGCTSAAALVRVEWDGGLVSFATGTGVLPPLAFESAAVRAFQLCAGTFRLWDGGRYPFVF